MKILKSSIFLAVFALICFFEVKVVNALEYNGYIYQAEKIDGIYFYKHRSDTESVKYDTHNFHEQATFYRRSSDKDYVYCIQNWTKLTGAEKGDYEQFYISNNKTNLSHEQLLKIEALGYFGYGYRDEKYNHTDSKWYAITQYLIWKIESPNIETYFVDSITSTTPLNIYTKEIQEIESLVASIEIFPNFSKEDLNHTIYDNLHLVDNNNSLSIPNITIVTSKHSDIELNGNNLTIKPLEKGLLEGTLRLSRKGNRFSRSTIIYESDKYQNAISIGNYSSRNHTYSIKDNYVDFRITKHCQKLNSFENDKFNYLLEECPNDININIYSNEDIYNNDGNLVLRKNQLIDKSSIDSLKLYPTKYHIELVNADKYLYQNTDIDLSDKINEIVHKSIYLRYQQASIQAKKIKEIFYKNMTGVEYNFDLGKNIKFGLYTKGKINSEIDDTILFHEDDLISTIYSDEQGIINFDIKIPYGKYYLKELDMSSAYKSNDEKYFFDFNIVGDESKRIVILDDIYNYLNKGIISICVVDEESNNPLKGIELAIFDENDNIIYSTYTNDSGVVDIELPYGNYYVKQINSLAEYQYSKDRINSVLDSEKINIEIKNKKIKINESGGITIPDIPKDDEIIIPDYPKEDDKVIEEGDASINPDDGFIIDVPSTLYNDYSIVILGILLMIILVCLKYEKKNL